MSIFKRALSMAMVLAMVFAMVPTAFAGGAPEISMGNVTVDISGGAATVTVPVMIANNPGFAGMDLNISIPEGWSIVSSRGIVVKNGSDYSVFYEEFDGEMEQIVTPQINPNKNGSGSFVAAYGDGDITADGILCWVKYNVPAGIESGDYEVSVSANKINNNADTATNMKGSFTFTAGTVTVTGGAAPHVHAYANPVYTWAGDNSTCTADAVCECGEHDVETVTATSNTVPAECGKNSVTTYTAAFTKAWATTQTKEVEGTDALTHSFTNYVSNGDATCTADGTKTAECDNGCGEKDTVADTGSMKEHVDADKDHACDYECGKSDMGTHADSNTDADHVCDYGCGEVLESCSDKADDGDHKCDVCGKADVTEHIYGEAKCDEAATCTECGATSGTAIGHSFTNYVYNNDAKCGVDGTETAECDRACGVAPDTRVKVGSALEHAWDAGVVTTPAKCEVAGEMTYTCGNDASHTKVEPIAAIGHKWDAGVVTKPAQCDVAGEKTYTCENDAAHTKVEPIAAPGHTWDEGTVTKPASCTENGITTYTCTVCGGTKNVLIDVLDHTYGNDGKCTVCGAAKPVIGTGSSEVPSFEIDVQNPANGEIEVDADAKVGEMVNVTVTPDKGYEVKELIVKDRHGNELKVKQAADGTFSFKMPIGDVVIEAVFVAVSAPQNVFTDVAATDYFNNAVIWAAQHGITTGVSATEFAPNAVCNRAQVVTFLWRAAGCPAPKSTDMPFADVAAGSYYYNAVLWAVENGITTGVSATEFAPNATVTRAQVVTFLFRAAKGGVVNTQNSFVDVEAGAYYYDAVQWAVANGITNGMSANTFAPANGCTRGQIVTFLYRAFN